MKNLINYFFSGLFVLSISSCSVDEPINPEEDLLIPELSAVNESYLELNSTTGIVTCTRGTIVTISLSSQDISGTGSAYVRVINNSSGSQIGATTISWTNNDGGEEKEFTFQMPSGGVRITGSFTSSVPDDEAAIYIKTRNSYTRRIYLNGDTPSFP